MAEGGVRAELKGRHLADPGETRTPAQRARRRRMLKTAVQLLEEREYDQIQIREVAEAADVALATLYRYFPSKELLYAHALITWGESFDEKIRATSRLSETDADRLKAALRRTVRAYEHNPNFYRLITVLEVTTDPSVRAVFEGYTDRFRRTLAEMLEETDERDAAAIVLVTMAVLGTLLRSWSLGNMPLKTVYERIDDAVAIVFSRPRPRALPHSARG